MFSQSLPRRKSLLSVRARTKTPATVSQDCLLGGCAFGASGYLKILYAIFAIIYIISLPGDCHAYARNDKRVGTPTRTNTYSERTYTRYVPIRSASRNGGENMSAELSSHTSSFCFNHNKLQLFALALCAPLPTRQKTSLSSLIYKHKFACFCRAGALVCVVQATAPCCCVAGAQRTVA